MSTNTPRIAMRDAVSDGSTCEPGSHRADPENRGHAGTQHVERRGMEKPRLISRAAAPMTVSNVHLDADPKGPTPEEMIADTKDGVLIEGTGSFSIDQQRYNGQFGGNAFWEIKNGKKTRMVTNVTYNAITTDFWGSLDAVSGPSSWRQFGLTGDAKGQPVQSQRVSHGSSWCRIRKIMVGGAFQ